MNPLPELFERGDPLSGIEAVQAGVLIRGMDYLSGHAVQSSSAGMRQPLRLGKVGFASPQLGGPLSHAGLQHVPGPAKLLFSRRALVDEGGVLEGRRSVIRSQAEQEPVDLRGKADATAGRGNDTALGVDTDRNGNTPEWPGSAADVGDDLNSCEPAVLGKMTFQPGRKRIPRRAPHDVGCVSGTGNAQANEHRFKLQQFDQCVGKPRRHGGRLPVGQRRRDSGQRHEISEYGSQDADLSIRIARHALRRAQIAVPDLEQQLLVDAVEERADMTMLAQGIPGEVRGVPGGFHVLTFTQIAAFWPGKSVRRGPDSMPQVAQAQPRSDERESAYARPRRLSTAVVPAGRYRGWPLARLRVRRYGVWPRTRL